MAAPQRPVPDDEKANSPVLYVAVGLVSIVLVVAVLALLFLPPALAAGFIIRGGRSGQPILKYIGFVLFLVWFIGFYLVGRRVMRPRRLPDEEPPTEGGTEEDPH